MNSNYLDLLPDEMLLKLLSETDDLETLSKWCQTSKRVNQICQDEGFWHNKYRKDFGIELTLAEGETWRERYKQTTLNINSPISGVYDHYGIIDRKGILYMAGDNEWGQLGNGTTVRSVRPIALQFKRKIIGISCSDLYTAALTEDGKIYVWGNLKNLGQIDEFIDLERTKLHTAKNILTPRLFNFPHPAIKIHAGENTLGIITTDHTPYFTGYMKQINIKALDIESFAIRYAIIGTYRKLYTWHFTFDFEDDLNQKIIDQPKHIPLPELVKQMSFGEDHYAVLSISGNVYIWGSNVLGALGLPSSKGSEIPTKLDLPSPISFISMGRHTSAALTRDGILYMWGANTDRMILNEDNIPDWVNLVPGDYTNRTNYVPQPIQISIEGKVINYVEVGSCHTLAVTDDGMVNYWGESCSRGLYQSH